MAGKHLTLSALHGSQALLSGGAGPDVDDLEESVMAVVDERAFACNVEAHGRNNSKICVNRFCDVACLISR